MLVILPLVLLAAPALPLLHGLPRWFVRAVLGPFLRWSPAQSLGKFLTHPLVCWIFAAVVLIAWHVPSAFELALRPDFLARSGAPLLFFHFHPFLVACDPAVSLRITLASLVRWSIPLYLFFGMFPGSALGAFLVFCDRALYPSYREAPALFLITPLSDQIIAGSLMWVLGMFVCLIPAGFITLELLSPHAPSPGSILRGSPLFPSKEYFSANPPSQL
jgi:putative membrane protein